MSNLVYLRSLFEETRREWDALNPKRMSAALAYRGMFSLFPIILLTLTLTRLLLGQAIAQELAASSLSLLLTPQDRILIIEVLDVISESFSSFSLWATLVGVGFLLYGATELFNELKASLNTIWQVENPRFAVTTEIRNRILALMMAILLSALLFVLFVTSTILGQAGESTTYVRIFDCINMFISLGLTILLFALIYRFVPNVTIAWSDVWMGGAVTAVLFLLGLIAMSIYFRLTFITSLYGGLGVILLLLLWIYYSAQIVLFGATFTRVYARRHGSHVEVGAADQALET